MYNNAAPRTAVSKVSVCPYVHHVTTHRNVWQRRRAATGGNGCESAVYAGPPGADTLTRTPITNTNATPTTGQPQLGVLSITMPCVTARLTRRKTQRQQRQTRAQYP